MQKDLLTFTKKNLDKIFYLIYEKNIFINIYFFTFSFCFISKRFKDNAEKYGFKKEEAIIFKIGEFQSLKNLLSYN